MLKIKDYLLIVALVLGVAVSFFWPGSIQGTFLTDMNNIFFIIVLFVLSYNFNIIKVDKNHWKSLKFIAFYLIATAIIMSGFLKMIFAIPLLEAIIFSTLICTTVAAVKMKEKKLTTLFRSESDISTPLMIFIAYIFIAVHRSILVEEFGLFAQIFQPIKEVIIGIGIGAVVGMLLYFVMKRKFTKTKIIIAIAAAFFAYMVSSSMEGNGFLSVIIVGLFAGYLFAPYKKLLDDFSHNIFDFSEFVLFFFVGYMLSMPWTLNFLIKTIILFIVLLLIRFSSVTVMYRLRPKDAVKATFVPSFSPVVIPFALIFVMSGNFGFMLLGFLLFGFIVLSKIVSMIIKTAESV